MLHNHTAELILIIITIIIINSVNIVAHVLVHKNFPVIFFCEHTSSISYTDVY